MTPSIARHYARQTLAGVFGKVFKREHYYKSSCLRVSPVRFSCGFSFSSGLNYYFGTVAVYYTNGSGGSVHWTDNYVVHRVNDYCYFRSGHRSRCRVNSGHGSW